MDTNDALYVAVEFLEEFPADGFPTTEALVAAAILWGENIGMQRARRAAIQAMDEAREKVRT
jgi:hypothetical protein